MILRNPYILPYDNYKIKIDFIGVNFNSPEKVVYQYKLEGYDDWSEPTRVPSVTYSRVEDGSYTFMLKACDENGVCTRNAPETQNPHKDTNLESMVVYFTFNIVDNPDGLYYH